MENVFPAFIKERLCFVDQRNTAETEPHHDWRMNWRRARLYRWRLPLSASFLLRTGFFKFVTQLLFWGDRRINVIYFQKRAGTLIEIPSFFSKNGSGRPRSREFGDRRTSSQRPTRRTTRSRASTSTACSALL